ncbi:MULTISPECIES: hypothetical protein [unclassified Curtobacterium]|uniref:hypothetical protein n=1 Tax=unclassified Curtobacterium TaxID=257496 RepID=UPI000D86BF72|nr:MULTISPECIES: hypothetical protein [unclassified Curtobacterium]PYY36399.1 hypothetical protein DEI89_04315 [Curtobacterium sp. MCBD17_030]PZE37167.1 hypothetical protein DEJ31_08610 [Curtobacterium sp. MCPF17_031]PZF15497.1 hypothetical protein DEJ25_01865 [Curtobacterium sp. MCPF17_011]
MNRSTHRAGRLGFIAVVAVTAALTLTSCGSSTPGGITVKPSTVKKSIVDLVERSTAAIGGKWEVYSGPSVEACGEGAEDKARYVYIMDRVDQPTGDPTADLGKIKALWKSDGIEVTDYKSGGADPLLGVRGSGGPTTSIGFDAFPKGYSVTGVSQCADGNVSELRKSE